MARASLILFATAASIGVAIGSTPPIHAQMVVPNGLADVEGNESNVIPWDNFATPVRYQQIYLGSEVGTGLIEEIRFRQDGVFGDPFGPFTLNGVVVNPPGA